MFKKILTHLPLAALAPLLYARIIAYSPLRHWNALRHWNVGPGQKVGIIGLGGLGHMGVKFAHAFGAKTYVITTSPNKKQDALKLGAEDIIVSKNPEVMEAHANSFDLILSTISAPYHLDTYLGLLKRDGKMITVGLPDQPTDVSLSTLVHRRKTVAGSMIGGIKETQEMLDFCGEHNITADVEVIAAKEINTAFERILQGDVHYRFVIDIATLDKE